MNCKNVSPFVIPLKKIISEDLQLSIIKTVCAFNEKTLGEREDLPEFWLTDGCTNATKKEPTVPEQHLNRYYYLNRRNRELSWEWDSRPLSREIKLVIDSLHPFVSDICRVSILVQIPGKEVYSHRDLIVGEEYPNMNSSFETYWGDKTLRYLGDRWHYELFGETRSSDHKKQNYYGLRIPLSEKFFESNNAYVNINNTKTFYSTGNHLFLLDEATHEHGADPVEHYRGVIAVDAKIDLTLLNDFILN